jgi:hypothetical protein
MVVCLLALLLGQAPARAAELPATWLPPTGFVEQTPVGATSALDPKFASERMWTRQRDGWTEHIVQMTTRKPLSLRRYLAHWRASHGCTLSPLRTEQPLSWAGKDQGTWSGACEGGDVFVMHIARLGDRFFEFHVGRPLGRPRPQGASASGETLRRLLGEISDPRGAVVHEVGRPRRAFSRAEARRRLMTSPAVRSLGDQVRLRPLAHAAEIGPGGCTGSAGECLYWFRADALKDGKWTFWRLLGVCPYDGDMFISTTPNVLRAQDGAFERMGRHRPRSGSGARGRSSTGGIIPE